MLQSTPDPGSDPRLALPTAKPPFDCVFITPRVLSAIRNPGSAIEGAAL